MTETLRLDASDIKNLLQPKARAEIVPAGERFLLPVPALEGGPILTPNVKSIEVQLNGTQQGLVKLLRCESSPQQIPADGKHVIVINNIDQHIALALKSKLEEAKDKHGGMTRACIEEFLSYTRGYEYDAEKNEARLAQGNAGFHCDIYFQTLDKAMALHTLPGPLETDIATDTIQPDRYCKKNIITSGLYIEGGPVEIINQNGQTQRFADGVMIQIAPDGGYSAIDPTDINACYKLSNNKPIGQLDGTIVLPTYNAQLLLKEKGSRMNTQPLVFIPADVMDKATTQVMEKSTRVYIRPDKFDLGGSETASFNNPTDTVTQHYDAKDGLIIAALSYPCTKPDYAEKSAQFHAAINAAYENASTFDAFIAGCHKVYSDMGLTKTDMYTSTRAKMKQPDLSGVSAPVVKENTVELLAIKAQPDHQISLLRESEHRENTQNYTGTMYVKIENRGNKYERVTAVGEDYVKGSYLSTAGAPLDMGTIATHDAADMRPAGVQAGNVVAIPAAGEATQQINTAR